MECNILLHRNPKKSFRNESFPFRTAVADRPHMQAKTKEGQRKKAFHNNSFPAYAGQHKKLLLPPFPNKFQCYNCFRHASTIIIDTRITFTTKYPLLFFTLKILQIYWLQAQTRITPAITANLILTQVLWIIDIQATVIPETYFIYQLESVSMHTS